MIDHVSVALTASGYSYCVSRTRNKMSVAIESGKGVKVKVVKLC